MTLFFGRIEISRDEPTALIVGDSLLVRQLKISVLSNYRQRITVVPYSCIHLTLCFTFTWIWTIYMVEMTNISHARSHFSLCISVKYTVKNTNSSRSLLHFIFFIFFIFFFFFQREQRLSYCRLPGNFCVRYKFCKNKGNVCVQTLYLLEKLMLDVKVVRRAAISDGTQGSWRGIDVIVIIAWQWYRSIIDCRFASLPLLRVTLSSLIVVLGVLRLTRCFSVFVYTFLLSDHDCVIIFFNVVRIALLYLPLSLFFFFFFTSAYLGCSSLIRCFAVALDVSGCSRCCAVDQCWLLLRYETVIRAFARFCDLYQKLTRIRFRGREHRHSRK